MEEEYFHHEVSTVVGRRTESMVIANFTVTPTSGESVCETVIDRRVTVSEAVACVISILTVLENVAILIAIKKGPRVLRKPPYWFIASLAAADLLTGLEVVLAISVPVGSSPLSRIALKGMAVVTFIASINSLLCVSFDRYLRIAHYADYDRFLTRKLVIVLIVLSWFVSFAVFLIAPLLGGFSCADQHCCADNGECFCRRSRFGDSFCTTKCSQSFIPFSKLYLLFGLIYFLVAISVMMTFYVALFRKAKKKMFDHGVNVKDTKSKKRDVQLAKTLTITLLVFIICWLPVMALFMADLIISENTPELSKTFDYALVPSVINSFLNPIIYSVRLPHMRFTLKKLFLSGSCRKGQTYFGSAWTTNTSMDIASRRTRIRNANKKENKRRNGTKLTSIKSHTGTSDESSNIISNSVPGYLNASKS